VASDIVDQYCLRFVIVVVHIVVAGYIVDHYYLTIDRGVFILLWLVIMLSITV
jgi:hypothetical protein